MTLESSKEDSEYFFLVREESIAADTSYKFPENNDSNPLTANITKQEEEEEEDTVIRNPVAKFHEHLLNQAGFGAFHFLVLLISGLGLAADAVELFAIAYLIPSAEHELCMGENQKGWLGTITFIGMMIGALLWGIMGDRLGRRRTLLSALVTNGIFGVIGAFMPTYSLLMVTRLCSGVGIGGSLPVVFSFYSEFLVRKNRGRHLSFLIMFWALGGLFVAVLAWGIIPRSGASIMESKRLHFARWRIFLLLCSLPAIISAIGVAFLPESPRFLLEMGRDNEALHVYKQIISWNNAIKSGEEYQLTELDVPGKGSNVKASIPSKRGLCREIFLSFEMFWNTFTQIFRPPHTIKTLFLSATWAAASFGFYGVSIWLHEYMKTIDVAEFNSRTEKRSDDHTQNFTFDSAMSNVYYSNWIFVNVKFVQMLISHCTFHNCSFINCTFSDIRSSKTFFKNCDFQNTEFLDTDLYKYKFESCSMNEDSSFFSTKGGCRLDFDTNFKLSELLYENIFAHLAILPGMLISSFVLDKIGRTKTLGASLIISGLCIFSLWFVEDKNQSIAFEAMFSFFSIFGWNALDIMSTEAFPANIRTTSYGMFTAFSRLAAILGNFAFANAIDVPKAIPILASSTVLFAGAACVTRLSETKDYLL